MLLCFSKEDIEQWRELNNIISVIDYNETLYDLFVSELRLYEIWIDNDKLTDISKNIKDISHLSRVFMICGYGNVDLLNYYHNQLKSNINLELYYYNDYYRRIKYNYNSQYVATKMPLTCEYDYMYSSNNYILINRSFQRNIVSLRRYIYENDDEVDIIQLFNYVARDKNMISLFRPLDE